MGQPINIMPLPKLSGDKGTKTF